MVGISRGRARAGVVAWGTRPENLQTFLARIEAEGGAGLPRFVKDEFKAFRECGILAHGFMRVRCAACGYEKLVTLSCKLRGICPSCGERRMAEAAAWLVDHVIPKVPVRQWVLSYPIPLRSVFAVHPELLAPVLQIIYRVIATHLIKQAGVYFRRLDTRTRTGFHQSRGVGSACARADARICGKSDAAKGESPENAAGLA